MLVLVAAADAHVPHDRAVAVAAPEGGAWLLVAAPGRDSLLLRSDDDGRTWSLLGGEPVADALVGAAARDDGAIALLGEARLWLTSDGGDAWTSADTPGGDRLAGGDAFRVGGEAGLHEWTGDAWATRFQGAVTALAPDGSALADDAGEVWVRDGDTYVAWGSPGDVTAAIAIDGAAWAGARDGSTWRATEAGAWVACGERASEVPEVTRLARVGDVLLVADGSGGPWASGDGCRTWHARRAPLDVLYEDEGGASSAAEGVAALGGAGDAWWMAGWAGVATSADAGRTWEEAVTIPSDYTRGLAFSPSFGADGTVWWGAYGGGVARTRDGGASFGAPNGGLGAPNVQELKVWGEAGEVAVIAIVAHHLFRSLDRGETWESLGTPFATDDQVFLWGDRDHLWAAGRATTDYGGSAVAETRDGGATWTTFDAFEAALDAPEPRGLVHVSPGGEPDVTCIGSYQATLACTEDEGETWARRFTGSGTMSTPVGWPATSPTRLVLADGDGVHRSDDGGRTWTHEPLDGDAAAELAAAGDGTLFLTTATGRLLRSRDGGEGWEDLGIRFGGSTFVLAPRPGFPERDDLLVGGADGVWHVIDAAGEPSLVRWGAWQRVEESGTFFLRCDGCMRVEAIAGASLGYAQRLDEGHALAGWMRGHTVRVLGVSEGGGEVALVVDGVERLRFGEDAVAVPGLLAAVGGLADAWHRVEVRGVAGNAVLVDALEAYGEGSALDWDGEAGGCGRGCAAIGLLPLFWRRKAASSRRGRRLLQGLAGHVHQQIVRRGDGLALHRRDDGRRHVAVEAPLQHREEVGRRHEHELVEAPGALRLGEERAEVLGEALDRAVDRRQRDRPAPRAPHVRHGLHGGVVELADDLEVAAGPPAEDPHSARVAHQHPDSSHAALAAGNLATDQASPTIFRHASSSAVRSASSVPSLRTTAWATRSFSAMGIWAASHRSAVAAS